MAPLEKKWSALALAGVLGLLPASVLAGRTYCCDDGNGRRLCSDTLPAACYKRAYQIREGGRTENVGPPLTPEQKAQREAELARKKAEESRAAEELRNNQILLNSYGSEKDFDSKRDRALAETRKSLEQAQARYDEGVKRQKRLANETEFYLKKPMPDALKSQIKENEAELSAQQVILDARKREIESIGAKFEAEKQRWINLARPRGLLSPANPR